MSDIWSLRREKSAKEQEVSNLESENAGYQAIIDRLEAAKTIINTSDNDLRDLRADIKKDYELYEDDWKGTEFDKYKAKIDDEIYDSLYKTYVNDGVNRVLDEICNLITSYENKIYQNQGAIGRLWSWINSLGNEIEKLLNNF